MNSENDSGEVKGFGYRSPRFPVRFQFLLTLDSSAERIWGECTDISEEGLAADLTRELPPRTGVTLTLILPEDSTPFLVKAQLEHRCDHHHGFKFLPSTTRERERIRSWIQSLGFNV